MKKHIHILYILLFLVLIISESCNKEEDIDTQKPVISKDIINAFPQNCDTLYFGKTFKLKMLFADNKELGSFSIDIHHNFDHHSHSTEVTECTFEDKKVAQNTFKEIYDFDIPKGLDRYETDIEIILPAEKNGEKYDEGDYHFFISLTDKSGWTSKMGLSIKIFYR